MMLVENIVTNERDLQVVGKENGWKRRAKLSSFFFFFF